MSPQTSQNRPVANSGVPDRRAHGRAHVHSGAQSVIYAELGGGQFGIITDLSEGGLAMQTVGLVTGDDFPTLSFRLSPAGNLIRPTTQVAWKSVSKKAFGLRFLALSPSERMELSSWIFTRLPMESGAPVVSSPPALPEPGQQATDPFGHLQELLTESTSRQLPWRKWAQWGLAGVLGVVLVFCFVALWRLAPRVPLKNLSALPGRSIDAVSSILGQTREWARGVFHLGDSEDRKVQIVPAAEPAKSKPAPSRRPARGAASTDSRAAATLRHESIDTPKAAESESDAASEPAGCRNVTDSGLTANADGGQNGGGSPQTTPDPTLTKPILTVGPTYPIMDAQSCVDGTVRLRATIDRTGVVRNLEPLSGPETLYAAAIDAARYWRFRPAVSEGRTVEADRDIQVVFRNMLADTQ